VVDRGHWVPFAISLRGVEAGRVTVRLVAGENRRLAAGVRFDDFEVRNVRLDIYGTNEPTVLPETKEAA
jgi:hypothetical protein